MRLAQRQRSRRRGDGGGRRGFASAEAERIRRQTRVAPRDVQQRIREFDGDHRLQRVCEILFFRRVRKVVFAARDERRAAKARKRDGVLLFLLFPLERGFVEEHVTRLVVGVDARDHGEPSEAVVSQNAHARADRDAGFRDDAKVRRARVERRVVFVESVVRSADARRRRKVPVLFVPGKQNSSVLPRHGAQERRARLDVLRRGGCEIASPEPKRAPGVGSCRGAPRGLDDGVFVFVSGNHDIRRDIRRLRVRALAFVDARPEERERDVVLLGAVVPNKARARLTRDRVPAASRIAFLHVRDQRLEPVVAVAGERVPQTRPRGALPGERHGLAFGRKRHLRGLHGAHARADRGRPRRRHQQRDPHARGRLTPSDASPATSASRQRKSSPPKRSRVDATSAVPSTRRAHRASRAPRDGARRGVLG